MACPTGASHAPERLSALRPPLDSGERSKDANPRAQKMRRGNEEVCVLEIVRPGMEDSESAEKQENTGIDQPARAAAKARSRASFTRYGTPHGRLARHPERFSALRPPLDSG